MGTAYAVGVNCRTVTLEGHPRRFIVYVPASAPVTGSRRPVVFMLHGTGGDGAQFLRISGWREQADATGLVAVFPDALRYRMLESGNLKSKWNSFGLPDRSTPAELPPGSAPGCARARRRRRLRRHDDRRPGGGTADRSSPHLHVGLLERRQISPPALGVDRSDDDRRGRIYSGGGLSAVQPPTAARAELLDRRDARRQDARQRTDPPLTELPLDPLEILTNSTLRGFVDIALQTQGLDDDSFGAVAEPHSTVLRWPAVGTGPSGALFRFGVLDDVEHEYPNGGNNRFGFEAAPEFWDFFSQHRLVTPAAASRPAPR